MRFIVAIALLGLVALVACQEYSHGGSTRRHRADDLNAEGGSFRIGRHRRADDLNAEGGSVRIGRRHRRADDLNAEGGSVRIGRRHRRADDLNAEGGNINIHVKIGGGNNHKKHNKKFDDFNREGGNAMPHPHPTHKRHNRRDDLNKEGMNMPHPTSHHNKPVRSRRHRLFESDYCAMTRYAECKSALAPFLGSIEAVLGAGDAINTCLKIKECPVAQTQMQPSFLGNGWTNFAEDLEKAGEWLLVDSQCEQDLGVELFIASNLIVDFKSIGNDIMDIIFMAMFGEKAYQACSPLI